MGLQGYGPEDLARLRSVQANAGRARPVVREPVVNGRRVRLIRRVSDTGAVIRTREYHRLHDQHRDVMIQAPAIRVLGGGGGR